MNAAKQREKLGYESRNTFERSELTEHIAQSGHEINWRAIERRASYSNNTGIRKIRGAIDIVGETNLMNRRLEEGRTSDNFAYCLSKLGDNKNTARPGKRKCLGQGSIASWRKRDRDEQMGDGAGIFGNQKKTLSVRDVCSNKPVQDWRPNSQGAGQTDKQTVREIRRYRQNILEIYLRCSSPPEIGFHSGNMGLVKETTSVRNA
ncbi:unnamed protein product [Protopolystoma xenopodis]|uniref:Uncharacterized protein n=1 Tax=Protopolystoma xenopodis TaxID=117903 RepID=A0A448WVX7_9PLAT|nr:unnamed protein product [Protopolystoma xenopodis]